MEIGILSTYGDPFFLSDYIIQSIHLPRIVIHLSDRYLLSDYIIQVAHSSRTAILLAEQNSPRGEQWGGPEPSLGIQTIREKKMTTCTLLHFIAGRGGEGGRESKAMCITNAGMSDI